MEQRMIMQVLDTVYEKALDGLPGSESIAEYSGTHVKTKIDKILNESSGSLCRI